MTNRLTDEFMTNRRQIDEFMTNRLTDEFMTNRRQIDEFMTNRRQIDEFMTNRRQIDESIAMPRVETSDASNTRTTKGICEMKVMFMSN
ncbi:hypothetical protein CEXT_255261 [Caerostris extrusa]|uniref:Uncharacterized protein n=1 Tax=Caerostris extrusa TaxID=172846 RepID=A0AAV4PHK4_CAEEX|nr:hypothetical protein CEXT_255261 [Caerostris extrusa]